MISQTVEYAFRTIAYLSGKPDRWLSGEEIAEKTRVPHNYLLKILNQLRKSGLVESRKGWGGGFMLPSRKMRTPLFQVVDILEGRKELGRCVFGFGKCDCRNPCPLHGHWERINESYRAMLRDTTFADLKGADLGRMRSGK